MIDPSSTVKDSSIWKSSSIYSTVDRKDPYIRLGIVKRVYRDERTTDLRYLVEVKDKNDIIEVNARLMRSYGGVYNYEDVILRGYKIEDKPDPVHNTEAKAGDIVLVVFLNGEEREAAIIGGLTHPARKSTIPIDKGPYYQSEFNGIEKVINNDGEYTFTFKGQPTNIGDLSNTPTKKIAAPKYDTATGGTYMKFDKTGSVEINDKAQSDLQRLRIDKKDGYIQIDSGKISIKLTKKDEKVYIKSKIMNVVSDNSISFATKECSVDATTSTKIKSPKVAIGKDGVELLDQIAKAIDALGKVIPISPVGPCSSLQSSPMWTGVAQVQSKIKEITGSL